jgi:hypothetical protein
MMRISTRDPYCGARCDREQWNARKLSWADAADIPDLQARRDHNLSRLRDKSQRSLRWEAGNGITRDVYQNVERWRVVKMTVRKHIRLARIDKVITILDLLFKDLEYHEYWNELTAYKDSGNKKLTQEQTMGEQARQCWHWWLSQARQELSIDREHCVNDRMAEFLGA